MSSRKQRAGHITKVLGTYAVSLNLLNADAGCSWTYAKVAVARRLFSHSGFIHSSLNLDMRVYLIRHGETDYNVERRFQGHVDIPLNARGESQAREAGAKLRHVHFDQVWSSDLERASRTAYLITGQAPIQLKDLRERYMGEIEGMLLSDASKLRGPEGINSFGESTEELGKRLEAAWHKILTNNPHDNILIVGHGSALRTLVMRLVAAGTVDANGLQVGQALPNCSVTVIEDGKVLEYGRKTVETIEPSTRVV